MACATLCTKTPYDLPYDPLFMTQASESLTRYQTSPNNKENLTPHEDLSQLLDQNTMVNSNVIVEAE